MSTKRAKRPHGQIRQSQIITTFGPGAMLDLSKHSVLWRSACKAGPPRGMRSARKMGPP
jgi:hypothetical protein